MQDLESYRNYNANVSMMSRCRVYGKLCLGASWTRGAGFDGLRPQQSTTGWLRRPCSPTRFWTP